MNPEDYLSARLRVQTRSISEQLGAMAKSLCGDYERDGKANIRAGVAFVDDPAG